MPMDAKILVSEFLVIVVSIIGYLDSRQRKGAKKRGREWGRESFHIQPRPAGLAQSPVCTNCFYFLRSLESCSNHCLSWLV
jgi:hypothetical protein